MPEPNQPHSFVFFPYLKTSAAVSIGGLEFRATEDTERLSPEHADHVNAIAKMLYLGRFANRLGFVRGSPIHKLGKHKS